MGFFKNRKNWYENKGAAQTTPSLLPDEYDKTFKQNRYKENKLPGIVDATDAYANLLEMTISFQHVPTGKSLYFKAFITTFNESYSCEWAQEAVYGRADPLYMFKSTTRRISLAFKVPAASMGEAYENLGKIQSLAQFLYPNYDATEYAQTISQSPLVRMKVMNLAMDAHHKMYVRNETTTAAQLFEAYYSTNDASLGLLGAVTSLTVNHNLENPDIGSLEKEQNTILPKMIDVNLEFAPIHEHRLGWDANGNFGEWGDFLDESYTTINYPYGVSLYEPDLVKAANVVAIGSTTDARALNELGGDADDLDFTSQESYALAVNDAYEEDAIAAYAVLLQDLTAGGSRAISALTYMAQQIGESVGQIGPGGGGGSTTHWLEAEGIAGTEWADKFWDAAVAGDKQN